MPLVAFYFQLHQPCRLHPDRDKFLWEDFNRDVFLRAADTCYLPALDMFCNLIEQNPAFKICLSMSGTFLEQAERFRPAVTKKLQELLVVGRDNEQVEYLDETYYHSLVSLFSDPRRQEFRDQVSLHRDMLRELFGIIPRSFRNTELICNVQIAEVVADMGYRAILCEKADAMVSNAGASISAGAAFRVEENGLVVIPRHREISDIIAFPLLPDPISPEQYAYGISHVDTETVLIGLDLGRIGVDLASHTHIFDLWRDLPEALAGHPNIRIATPMDIVRHFDEAENTIANTCRLREPSDIDLERDSLGWISNPSQHELFRDIEMTEQYARRAGGSSSCDGAI